MKVVDSKIEQIGRKNNCSLYVLGLVRDQEKQDLLCHSAFSGSTNQSSDYRGKELMF